MDHLINMKIFSKRKLMFDAYLRNEDITSSSIARFSSKETIHKIKLAKPSGYFNLSIWFCPEVNQFCYDIE